MSTIVIFGGTGYAGGNIAREAEKLAALFRKEGKAA